MPVGKEQRGKYTNYVFIDTYIFIYITEARELLVRKYVTAVGLCGMSRGAIYIL